MIRHAAVFHHHNAIGFCKCRESMRNHNRRHPTAPRAHGVQNAAFGLAINRAQRVIQQQNVRVAHQGARNGKPLSLPAGKGDAALADHGFPAALETQD